MMFRVLMAGMVCVTLAGCTLHQANPVELNFDLPGQYRGNSLNAFSAEDKQPWWHLFHDDHLNDLMTTLFEQNLDLARAFARLRQVQGALDITRASQLPFATAEGKTGRDRSLSGFIADSSSAVLTVGYELDLWRKFASRAEAAEFEVLASTADIRTLYLSLSAQLAELYFYAVEQRSQINLTERTVAAFSDTLNRVERRYRAGLVDAVDVYLARQNLVAAQSRRPALEAGLAAAEHAIAVLLGNYPVPGLAGSVDTLPLQPQTFPVGLPAELLSRRPDVQAAFDRLKASDAQIAAAIADRLPAINLLGGLGRGRTELMTGPASGEIWSLLAGVALPVFDGGRRRAEVERREAVFQESLAAYRQTVLSAFREVEDGLVANRTTEETIHLLVEKAAATESALRLALDRYQFGLTEYLPVLVAQASHLEAQSQLLSARRQLVSDRIFLAKSLGGYWMQDELARSLATEED
jgi:NodT family efflux transporter outer membrane factor (OMF) lipoprotein